MKLQMSCSKLLKMSKRQLLGGQMFPFRGGSGGKNGWSATLHLSWPVEQTCCKLLDLSSPGWNILHSYLVNRKIKCWILFIVFVTNATRSHWAFLFIWHIQKYKCDHYNTIHTINWYWLYLFCVQFFVFLIYSQQDQRLGSCPVYVFLFFLGIL